MSEEREATASKLAELQKRIEDVAHERAEAAKEYEEKIRLLIKQLNRRNVGSEYYYRIPR